jgi:outer membrane immunogenic protein
MRPIWRLSASSGLSLASAILSLALCGFAYTALPAHAADMAVPRSYYPAAAPPPAIYDWTGIYLGGHIGGGMLVDSVSQNGASAFGFGSTGDLRPAGVIGGFQAGANYEFAPWVVGIEGTWTASAIEGNTLIPCVGTCTVGTGPTAIAQERFTSQAPWFATLTGRAGYAANDWLFYAKVGGAWTHVRYTEDLLKSGGVTVTTQNLNDNRSGFTVGAGIEWGLVENISAKVEYDFYDFGSRNYNFTAITPVTVKSDVHTLTVGLNYKFNWSGGPKP